MHEAVKTADPHITWLEMLRPPFPHKDMADKIYKYFRKSLIKFKTDISYLVSKTSTFQKPLKKKNFSNHSGVSIQKACCNNLTIIIRIGVP